MLESIVGLGRHGVWRPEGGWLTVLFLAVACAAVLAGVAVARVGKPGARLATGAMLAYLVVVAAAAATRINLAVDRGRSDLDMVAILVAFGLTGAAAVCMLVIAVVANLEAPL